ncbi:MAG: altronate dehydratase [Planctomycetaceae bacterium]|nr:altronate dehydratase [Planctomycetaceae bacterium]
MDATEKFICLDPGDNVVVARVAVAAGDTCTFQGRTVTVTEPIGAGHKMAIQTIPLSENIVKYGQPIGCASSAIDPGRWVHVHNVAATRGTQEYEFCTDIRNPPPVERPRTFPGYRRPDGSVGTRNYIALISTVNCSATAARYVADELRRTELSDYPNIDGIIPLVHKGGCAFSFDGEDHQQLNRTLAGFARHPNIGARLVLGLGCETAQAGHLQAQHQLVQLDMPGQAAEQEHNPLVLNIQDVGGVRKTVDRAVGILRDLLPLANQVERVEIPLSELKVGLECGGSDGNSGITANPALGYASDLLVAHGGTAILSEIPEVYGAEQLLTRRSVSREVAEQLLERIRWWENYAKQHHAAIDNNPSVGNKLGGLTTIFEKSLGAVAKGGTSPLRAVYRYAEAVTERGFVLMDTPGYDPASVTGMVAGGAQVIVFTTGRGSCFGCKPAPTIKVATNSPMYHRMRDDMDINAGTILEGSTVEDVGREIFEMIVATASGHQTLSEQQGIGDEEFCPWTPGPIF